uniref:Uncharacterized protein n=1 Tax=Anopheles quadriannulatus TaxID=34691 RepID=A0A182XTG4_ANOQN
MIHRLKPISSYIEKLVLFFSSDQPDQQFKKQCEK